MSRLTVLEHVRDREGVWVMPRPLVAALARDFPEVRFVSPVDPAEVDRALPEADVVLGWAVRPENFAGAARLKWIQVTAASVAALMFPALAESQVVVTNGRGLHAAAMAEHTLGVLLAFARKLHLARDAQRDRRWAALEQINDPPAFASLAGARLGLVGFGAIGRAIAERARAFGMEIVAVRRHPAADPAPAGAQWGVERLDELIAWCDALVLVTPLTSETRGLIDARRLALLKSGAVLVSLGRGAVVDEPALVEALRGGLIQAALDVFVHEPLAPESPLWTMPNVIVTPHTSGLGPRLWERAADLFRRNLRAYLDGRPLENVVDKRAGY